MVVVFLVLFLIAIILLAFLGVLDNPTIEFNFSSLNQLKDPEWSTWKVVGQCQREQLEPEVITSTVCIPTFNTVAKIPAERICLLEGCVTLKGESVIPGFIERASLDCAIPSQMPYVGLPSCLNNQIIEVRVLFPTLSLYLTGFYSERSLLTAETAFQSTTQLWNIQVVSPGGNIRLSQIRNGVTYGVSPNDQGFLEIGTFDGLGWNLTGGFLSWVGNGGYVSVRDNFLFLRDRNLATEIRLEVF